MKNIVLILAMALVAFSCKNESKDNSVTTKDVSTETSKELAYNSFGMEINDDDALSADRMMTHYNGMKVGDTLNAKMRGTISEVCSKKGCWMKLDMGNDKVVRVTFKDYGFFMPLNATGEVVVNGKAFVSETSVDDLKHYAEDAGKSADEIAAITLLEITYAFEADGVLLKK